MSESDTATDYVCEECRESVSLEATTCPHCGHDPGAGYRKSSDRMTLVGALLCLTIIGAPLGIWLYLKARGQARRAEQATPAVEA